MLDRWGSHVEHAKKFSKFVQLAISEQVNLSNLAQQYSMSTIEGRKSGNNRSGKKSGNKVP